MIEMSVTVDSFDQARQLVELDIDVLCFGEEEFGLRLPHYFTRKEMSELVELAHKHGKKARVAVSAIMHPDKMEKIPEYLQFLESIGVDDIIVGDPGVIYVLQRDGYQLPYVYNAETMVTSSRQVNFWAKRGAKGAILAREIPFEELQHIGKEADVFTEVLVYGATCIHHSKRPLITNYFNFTQQQDNVSKEDGLFISEPKDKETHYSIFEDKHGTHIYATNDVDLMFELNELYEAGLNHWKLDGMYTPGEAFVTIVSCFIEAKKALIAGIWTEQLAKNLQTIVMENHPIGRSLDTGFYYLDPEEIK
ncbi:peptidase U32 family protein [Vagococcus luciliae]|uniref:Peptidase U32 n=1 Tax=Vagococcus luciliae TaxID=2920380 RepID=A0ABY5NXW9_9ENTE|nr:peptidase U32 family protein [Vagococcus luciliae]UUV98286.1 hypothetical protein G314FT_03780 [Vagococcus luciliae]